ncbi:MAG TPA: haloacid dehalogenase, partial [Candidatus Competibacteraceae bacterium]|nr:haloacid dehalogenase [Candidatus Competibacteraceae bacterium]
CAHALGSVKEQPEFWPRFRELERFDPVTTLLVDDNLEILRTARGYGIGHLVSVLRPDSTHSPTPPGEFSAIHDFSELLPVS